MVDGFIDKIIDVQVEKGTILEQDIKIYKYGYLLLYELFLNIVIAVVIGLVTNRLGELLIFLLLYVPLRSFCGGWHADKLWKCTIYSNSMLILLCITISYEKIFFRPIIMVLIFIIGIIFVGICAPVETQAKPISSKEKKVYKKRIILIQFIHCIGICLLLLFGKNKYIYVITYAYVMQSVLLIVELFATKCRAK
ncbi:MAG: accessory gene regulator B family protein [Lachnospiraceae bacterium]|nr:accessory gene regulator B family protein [Lachnospiraceae bacterium]